MIYENIEGLINQALHVNLIENTDAHYVRNQIINRLELDTFPETVKHPTMDAIPNILGYIISYSIAHGVIHDTLDDKEILSANIMNCFVARPSTINGIFYQKYDESPKEATNYFYNLSKSSNYIQMNRIAKNISYKAESTYGDMDITINLSKPEKDPEQIKRERTVERTENYPKCLLCIENEGYTGRTGHPARANHRMIKVPLLGENWYFQYSPYVYYNEHSILISEEHREMKIDKDAFKRLLLFTKKFPHYFIGSNADLPIVGGSILSHDHYQAGRYEFAMMKAKDAFTFGLDDFPEISASVVKWPMSIIRLKGENREELVRAAEHVLNTWRNYSDLEANIVAFTEGIPHNTVTPIAKNDKENYELYLVLRNNRKSKEYPLGIFHPHADVHHIKKENIGLIEVMGLAVLPPRLKLELTEIKEYLLDRANEVSEPHKEWANQLKEKYNVFVNEKEINEMIKYELGQKFIKILEDAGVFKKRVDFEKFISVLNKDFVRG